jgi:thioredoxin-dependent peroxiredoxin
MEAYRDQYATLFNNGKKVTVIGISTDPDTLLANWARESGFPLVFASDPEQNVSKLYGSADGRSNTRNVFVIGPDGRITHRIMRFNVLSADAYTELGTAVTATLKPSGGSH